MHILLVLSVGVVLVICCQSANVMGQCTLPTVPPACIPTTHPSPGNDPVNTTCLTANKNNATVTNWYEMEDVCQKDNGRLIWLRDDFSIKLLLGTLHPAKGTHLVVGLLASPADKTGTFWRNPNDTSTFQCTNAETTSCLSNSTEETCKAAGCCWKNGLCQYPNNQTIPTFEQSELDITGFAERQCVGYKLNDDSTKNGTWVNYNCSNSVDNAMYVCEYKCNADHWPIMNVTKFVYESITSPSATSTKSTTETPKTANETETGATVTTSSPQAGNNVNCNKNSLLKVLLSLETGGAMTNMSFSLQQKSP